jgi:hypothetical protein
LGAGNRHVLAGPQAIVPPEEGIAMDKSPAQVALGLRIHAICFVVGVIAAVVVNLWVVQPYWFQWVLLGWSVGLLCHWWFTRDMRKSA